VVFAAIAPYTSDVDASPRVNTHRPECSLDQSCGNGDRVNTHRPECSLEPQGCKPIMREK